MKRVIIVGLHNKPGMKPLDSRTKSGKLIDRVIKELHNYQVVKTNLFDVDYFPTETMQQSELAFNWIERAGLNINDVVVVLGAATRKSFPPIPNKTIYIAHPASKRSHIEMNDYVTKTVFLIAELNK